LYLIAQVVVILLQNRYGGVFFLPRRFRRQYFRVIDVEGQCPICLVEMEVGVEVVRTPCGHLFHTECLRRWSRENMTCPVCRAGLPP
jgi:hypothetical protein